jgi:hypothetical protein
MSGLKVLPGEVTTRGVHELAAEFVVSIRLTGLSMCGNTGAVVII